MSAIELKIAQCCGTCLHTYKPNRNVETHAPHYAIAKTERWCAKHNIPTVREAVCDDWELENKKGGAAAVKRALSQNRRMEAILKLKDRLAPGKPITWSWYEIGLLNGYVVYKTQGGSYHKMSCKENAFDELLRLK